MYLEKLKEMFTKIIANKDASLIPAYYHKDFLLYTNGTVSNYNDFLSSHQEHLASSKSYQFEYDEETFLEQGEKLAGRLWITISVPNEKPKKIEVMLIVEYKENKLYRLWELTYPDWSQLPEFL